ncbi:MAG: transcriptional regulator [Pseudomonadota bacterium]
MSPASSPPLGAAPSLDPLLHQPLRSQVAAYLVGRGEATFSELKRVLQCTDGNLEAHLKKLIAAGYLQPERRSDGARGQTAYRLTPVGRSAFADYLLHLQQLFNLAPVNDTGVPEPAGWVPAPSSG